ncbi:hypothetical protein FALBO_10255 [Fusarium albosuccineum]|uniref:Uncharacterized protein n=1 Tax=Fusarium albosuccineum TaxID=1237068 RepID=A0A8H4L6D0_9HYPO|nr:hypothetical protein FALBO_10255 [Fusarium albosuccineum]
MPRRAPAEKLPLAVRKNIRDEWENKKEELEQNLSEVLGVSWTVDVDFRALYPYAQDSSDWAANCLGEVIARYVEGVAYQLRQFIPANGDEAARDEINEICSAHVLKFDIDEKKTVNYNGCKVSPEGELIILFTEGNLGVNVDDATERSKLAQALNEGPSRGKPMSYIARTSIRTNYDPKISEVQRKLKDILGQDIALVPNFEDNFAKLKDSPDSGDRWQENLGYFILSYFEGLASQLEWQKFGDDDMLQEGFFDGVEGRAAHFRVVDQLKRTYNEAVIEGGVLYLQTIPKYLGTNVSDAADGLINML